MFPPEVIAQERKHERISAIITAILMAILLLILFLAVYTRARDVQIGNGEDYQVVGTIDFGDYREGNQQVNNFEPATRNATPTPPQPQPQPQPTTPPPQAQPIQNVPVADNNPAPSDVITTEEAFSCECPPSYSQTRT